MPEKKLVKASFEYDDGTKISFVGKDAETWGTEITKVVMCAYVHGVLLNLPDPIKE